MATPTGGGYFAFDTNAEAVANRIGTSMAKIQSELGRVTARTAVGSNFDTGSLFRSIAQVNQGFEKLGETFRSGGLKPAQYLNQFRDQAVRGLAEVEKSLATQVARQPAALLDKTNLGKLGRDAYSAYNQGIVEQARALVASDPRFARSETGRNLVSNLQRDLGADAQTRSRRLLSTDGLDPSDAARLRAYYESQAALIKSDRLGDGRLSQIPGLAAATRGGDRDLTNTADDPAYRPRRAQLQAVEQQILAEQRLATFQNQTADAQAARLVRDAAQASRTADQQMAHQRSLANFENQTRTAQSKILDQAYAQNTKVDAARLKSAQTEAIATNKRLDGNRVVDQGSQFGSFGRVGQDLFRVDKAGATRIELNDRVGINAALQAEDQHRQKVIRDQEKQNQLTLRQSGSLSDNFLGGALGRGFNGSGNGGKPSIGEGIRNEMATLGTVARYSGVYAVLGAVTAGIADTKTEVLDFTDSLTDLKVALNVGNVSSGLVDQLQQVAILSGSNTGAALDAAARGARAFGDVAAKTGSDTAQAGTDIATAATKISLITGKDLRDATGDVIAIASAFGLAAAQANQVVDAVSAAKDFGGDPTNISQGLANFATTAGAAGFTLGEAANALSLVIARTDQSGQAAATRLSRITSILAGSTGRSVIADLNAAGLRDDQGKAIDPEASVRDQLRQIAQAYQKAGPELQGQIRSSLGGTSNLRELLPLLEDGAFEKILSKGQNQAGRGDQEFRRRTTDLVGVLKKVQGDISAIQVNLFRSGAFAGIGLAFKGLEPALNVLARLLALLDQVPGPIKNIVGALLDLKLALLGLRAVGVVQSASLTGLAGLGGVKAAYAGAPSAVAGAAGAVTAAETRVALATLNVAFYESAAAVATNTEAQVAQAVASQAAASADLEEATASLAAARGGLGAAAASARGGIGAKLGAAAPGLAIAGAVAAAYLAFQAGDKLNAIHAASSKSSQAVVGADLSDAGSVRGAANSLRANAAELRESQKGWHNLSGLMVKTERDQEIATEHRVEKQLRDMAKAIDAEDRHSIALKKATLFGDDAAASAESVATALGKLAAAGADAVGQFDALINALLQRPGADGKVSLPSDSPNKFAGSITSELLAGILPGSKRGKGPNLTFPGAPEIVVGSPFPVQTALSGKDLSENTAKYAAFIQAAAAKKLKSYKIPAGTAPTDAQLNGVVDAALEASGLNQVGPEYAKLRKYLRERILGKARGDLKGAATDPSLKPLDPKAAVDQIVGTDKIPGLTKQYESAISALPSSDIKGRQSAGRDYIAGLKLLQRRAVLSGGNTNDPEAMATIARSLAVAQEKVSTDLLSDMEDVRLARQAQAKGHAEVARIGKESFDAQVAAAVENGNLIALIDIFDKASQVEITLALAAADAASSAASAYVERLSADHGSIASIDHAEAEVDKAKTDADLIREGKRRSKAPKKSKDNQYLHPDLAGGSADKDSLTAAQIEAARLDAKVGPNDARAQAAADLRTARANLAAISKSEDPGGYYAAQKALRQAKATYADTELSLAASSRNLRATRRGGDLAKARADLQNALDDLTKYRKGTAEYNNALAQVVSAQNAAAEAAANVKFLKRRANSDLTDDVAQARIDRREAEAKLRRDRRAGKGPEVIAQDRIDVQNARNKEEQSAFDRRLRDAQTNESLGRISHAAYIKYLQGEHDRLASIKNKTQQQIDQLNEVDQALKSASEQLTGQFNLGDIKVPTPYEARTAVNASAVSISGQRSGTTQNISIQVDGADTGQILTVLQRVLGPLSTQRSTLTPRKGN